MSFYGDLLSRSQYTFDFDPSGIPSTNSFEDGSDVYADIFDLYLTKPQKYGTFFKVLVKLFSVDY